MAIKENIELAQQYSHKEVEPKWSQKWLEQKLWAVQINEGRKKFSIALPPPNVTGELHMGHALSGTIQDVLIRYHRMLGRDVLWQIGTDHAGIGTQIVVEKMLKKTERITKDQLGRNAFIERIKDWKEEYGNKILEQMKVLGFSPDYDRTRYTMDDHYSKAVKQSFAKYFNEDKIYRGKRITNWCPHCLTSLSDLEIDKKSGNKELYEIRYDFAGSKDSVIVATTRPETMFGDTAVAINPKDERYTDYIDKIQAEPGSIKVKIPFTGKEIPVVLDEHVKLDFGTGALKVTPAHDPNDFDIGKRHNLDQVVIMDETAIMLECDEVPPEFQGLDRYKAREAVVEALGETLVKTSEYEQEKDLHDRCGTEIEPYLSNQWYVDMKELAKAALNTVIDDKRATFTPERYTGLFSNWLENIQDWCVSRQIWWGHRIPIFYYDARFLADADLVNNYTKASDEDIKYFASEDVEHSPTNLPAADLSSGQDLAALIDLQAKHTDLKIYWQDEDVLDTWFSSALWPFETMKSADGADTLSDFDQKVFDKFYPTDVLATAREIINLWVSRMIFSSEYFESKEPFKDILIHPVVQTPDGKRMSKSKGNAINPLDLVELYGSDASRMWYASVGVHGNQDVRFPGKQDKAKELKELPSFVESGNDKVWMSDTIEQYRKFCNKLFNATKFTMMKLDENPSFKPVEITSIDKSKFSTIDTWILDKMTKALQAVEKAFAEYDLSTVQACVYEFLWFDFCDWYIESTKVTQTKEAKETQRQVLFYVLETSLRALQPIMPFITEELWQVLRAKYDFGEIKADVVDTKLDARFRDAIAFAKYPSAKAELLDADNSSEQMEYVTGLISNLRNVRQSMNISWANELKLCVSGASASEIEAIKAGADFVKAAAKVSELSIGEIAAKPATSFVLGEATFTIALEGLVDIEKLQASLQKKIDKILKEAGGLEGRLKSEKFVANAPADKVQEVRDQHADLMRQKEIIEADISALS